MSLNPGVWKNILKSFDQSTFDINFSQEDFHSRFENALSQKQFRSLRNDTWDNDAKQQDLVLLASKIEFSDFLKAIQRESVLRDILAEH